jgi:hypothetical protein
MGPAVNASIWAYTRNGAVHDGIPLAGVSLGLLKILGPQTTITGVAGAHSSFAPADRLGPKLVGNSTEKPPFAAPSVVAGVSLGGVLSLDCD